MSVLTYPEPVLKVPAAKVDDFDEASALAPVMIDVMHDEQGHGVAANQIGAPIAMFVYRQGDQDKVMVNPKIVASQGQWKFMEGCLSLPGVYFDLTRPRNVHMVGQDLDGARVEIHADNLLARIFQHEMDHLRGRLILDRVSPGERKRAQMIMGVS